MASKNLVLYGDATGALAADTGNNPSTVVMRDTDGSINIGTAKCTGVANTGTETVSAGSSTAAAGSTTADAAVLPAGTNKVYGTTGADGTKGVRIHASEKFTGRMIFIGNGVSNQILKVYAPSGGSINGAAADAAYSTASGKGAILYCLDQSANTWLAWG